MTLRSFKGDASIDYKWKTAKHLEALAGYGKPIIILYFGDYDAKGLEIPNSALKDIRAWCSSDFTFIQCGINKEHIDIFQLPEQPDKPGAFQWEALSEAQAQKLILGNLQKYWSLGAVKRVEQEEARATARWVQLIESVLEGGE